MTDPIAPPVMMIGRRSPADPCHTTVRTGPYTAVRDGYASIPRIRTECGLGFRFQSSPRTAQPLPSRLSGFTHQRRREVQFDLGILLFVVLETHGLLASPSRSGLRPSFPAWPILAPPFGIRSASLALPTSRPNMP